MIYALATIVCSPSKFVSVGVKLIVKVWGVAAFTIYVTLMVPRSSELVNVR